MRTIKGVLVDVEKETVGVVEIEKSLGGYYDAIKCCCISITSRTIGGYRFDIVLDDEGLLYENPKISAVDRNGEAMLLGNLFVVKSTIDGDLRSLTDAECDHVMRFIRMIYTKNHPNGYPVLSHVDYEGGF